MYIHEHAYIRKWPKKHGPVILSYVRKLGVKLPYHFLYVKFRPLHAYVICNHFFLMSTRRRMRVCGLRVPQRRRTYVRGHAFGILKIVQGDSVFFKILTLIVAECIGPYLNI